MTGGENKPKLREIAERIYTHLRRMEPDPSVNAIDPATGQRFLHNSGCNTSGCRVFIWYIAEDGPIWLTRDEATTYLDWLDAGNHGRHDDPTLPLFKKQAYKPFLHKKFP